jgi:N-acetylneuraminic acid mutarotase
VIIEGDAFGDLQGTGKVLFSDGAGGTIEATISTEDDWTNTFIVTTVPSGTEDGDVVVQTATGTSNALPFKVTSSAVFSPSEINWTVTTDLPTAVSGHQAVFVPIDDATGTTIQYVHVTGGADDNGAPINKVYVGLINSDGTITTWPNTTDLPDVRAFHASVAATPFNSRVKGSGNLYVLGGINAAGGQPVTTVYRGTLNDDGTIASWSETTPLPVPLHSLGAVVFRSTIYVAGGATTDNAPVATVYRAQIDTTGELGAWEELPSLPSARSYHGFATFGGFLYSVGGETDTVAPSDGNFTNNDTKLDEVVFVKINLRTGALADSNWTINGNSLGKKRSKHSALVAGGNIFVSAGLYSGAGTGSSENTFAQIFSDGTVDAFGGATGSNTLLSEGGANLFSHAAISYIDANGVAHVMILGGDNVNDPGVKRVKVLFY